MGFERFVKLEGCLDDELAPDRVAMKKFKLENLQNGYILGKAKLIDVKKYKDSEEFKKDKKSHLATLDFGRFGFILEGVERLKPRPAKEMLGFWEEDSKKSCEILPIGIDNI